MLLYEICHEVLFLLNFGLHTSLWSQEYTTIKPHPTKECATEKIHAVYFTSKEDERKYNCSNQHRVYIVSTVLLCWLLQIIFQLVLSLFSMKFYHFIWVILFWSITHNYALIISLISCRPSRIKVSVILRIVSNYNLVSQQSYKRYVFYVNNSIRQCPLYRIIHFLGFSITALKITLYFMPSG